MLFRSLALALMAAKFTVMLGIGRAIKAPADSAQRLAISLAQGGEFAFVLFSAAGALGVIDTRVNEVLVMAVTLSMLLAPFAFVAHEKLLARWLERKAEPEYDSIDGPGNPVIIAGFGRFGQIVARVLRMCGIATTALEASYQQVDFVRKFEIGRAHV